VETRTIVSVVDDDQSMTKMLARVLKASGFEVEIYHSAEEFLGTERDADTACLVFDVDLPGMSGIELQSRLKRDGVSIPILFISGQASEQTKQQAFNAGAIGFLNKPFSIESLLETIRSVNVAVR
jgi:FixJ family two-component response regulator